MDNCNAFHPGSISEIWRQRLPCTRFQTLVSLHSLHRPGVLGPRCAQYSRNPPRVGAQNPAHPSGEGLLGPLILGTAVGLTRAIADLCHPTLSLCISVGVISGQELFSVFLLNSRHLAIGRGHPGTPSGGMSEPLSLTPRLLCDLLGCISSASPSHHLQFLLTTYRKCPFLRNQGHNPPS